MLKIYAYMLMSYPSIPLAGVGVCQGYKSPNPTLTLHIPLSKPWGFTLPLLITSASAYYDRRASSKEMGLGLVTPMSEGQGLGLRLRNKGVEDGDQWFEWSRVRPGIKGSF